MRLIYLLPLISQVLRDLFSYKPPITKDQFFSRGFAERKVIMCTEILQLVKDKAAELNPGAAKTTLKVSLFFCLFFFHRK